MKEKASLTSVTPQITNQKICRIEGCQKTIYAKSLCHYHYMYVLRFKREPLPITDTKCVVNGCDKKIARSFEAHKLLLCNRHMSLYRARKRRNTLTDISLLSVDLRTYKKENRETKFMYKDHYNMKVARKKLINESSSCSECNKKGYLVLHHIDGSKDNHDISNLMILCQSCHRKIYHPKKNKKGCEK